MMATPVEEFCVTTEDQGHGHFRRLLLGEQVVGHLWVYDYQMKIDGAVLTCGGIGGVETRPEFRKRGYMRYLLQDTVAYMQAQGQDLSLLFGIRDFYHKFGYAPVLPNYSQTMETRDAELAPAAAGYRMRPFTPEDLPAMLGIHAQVNLGPVGTVLRDPAYFTSFRMGSTWGVPTRAIVVENGAGEIVGYGVHDDNARVVNIVEVGALLPDIFGVLLQHYAQLAVQQRCEALRFFFPTDHPFLSRPYLTEVTGLVKPGANTLCVEVTNHLGYTMKDFLSRYYAREASGLLGPIRLLTGEQHRVSETDE